MENKHKHLEFIQSVINRMASNSFLLKGWSVTLVAALFALSAKESNLSYVILAYFPVLLFWILDAYFLSKEKAFRDLYDEVRKLSESQIDFSMDIKRFGNEGCKWFSAFFSTTLIIFYLTLILVMLAIILAR